MSSRKQEKERLRHDRLQREATEVARERAARRLKRGVGAVVAAAVVGLGVIFAVSAGGSSDGAPASKSAPGGTQAGKYAFEVGDPGPGEPAPRLSLPSTKGGTWDLASQRGKTTLVYFHEGLMCQPCLQQISDIEANWSEFDELGIDTMVAISGDPLDNLEQAARDLELRTPLLSDPGVEQSATWEANKYGMMGTTHNGHSFIVVGPDGTIRHRADYGGAPDYTMFVPSQDIVADAQTGLQAGAGG